MTEDDATDVRLRDRAERWRHDAPPAPDVDDALRRARTRTRRPHVVLQVAAVAVLVIAVSVGALVLTRHATNSRHETAHSRVPVSTIAKLSRVAMVGARQNGDPSASAQAVETTFARAVSVLGFAGGNVARPDARVWLIQLRGSFECGGCSEPLSGRPARRQVLTEVLLKPSLGVSAFGLGDKVTDLSRFGQVIDLPLRRSPAPTPPEPTERPRAKPTVTFAGTAGSNQFVFAVGTGPDGAAGSHLVVTDTSGSHTRDIGPNAPANYEPDSVFFLDAQHGWFLVENIADVTDRLYRTSNGGRTWQSFVAPGHNGPGSSTVQFTSPEEGWLTDAEPTGPNEGLYRTRDGGATWQLVAALGRHTEPAAALPRLGLVNFTPDGSRGWLAGGNFSGRLAQTTDHGRHWSFVRSIPVGQQDVVGVPAVFGSTVVTSVTRCTGGRTGLQTYASSDGDNSWSHSADYLLPGGCRQVSTAFPTAMSAWAVARNGQRLVTRRTTDQGLDWSTVTGPDVTIEYAPTVTAVDADHAVLTGLGNDGTEVYATTDGGHTWRRIDQSLTRA